MISYLFIRIITLPFMFFPYRWINAWGNSLGNIAYSLLTKFRKRALSNLALAKDLRLSEKEILQIARESFQNLMITCLQYPKLSREKEIWNIAICENPELAEELLKKTGIVFFCGHQANWEVLFLEGTKRMPGVAIGRPIKNMHLYKWILSIRQKYGGKVVPPKNAIREGMRALKNKCFLGIVGDQGMPDSGFSSPFFGRLAWTSPMPAMLAIKMECPIIVATTKRIRGEYRIHYSDPIYPAPDAVYEKEIKRLMMDALRDLEDSIKEIPGQWLWQHNRWKQQSLDKIKRAYRHDAIAIILPQEKEMLAKILPHLPTFREIYPTEFIEIFVPTDYADKIPLADVELQRYDSVEDILVTDYRPKLIFNFSKFKRVHSHFMNLSAMHIVTLDHLKRETRIEDENALSIILKSAILHHA